MMATAPSRPYLTERQKELLYSLGLHYAVNDMSIIVRTPDECIVRLDVGTVDAWLDGYLHGKSTATGREKWQVVE